MKSPTDSAARVAVALDALGALDWRETRLVEAHLLVQRLRDRDLALLESVLPVGLDDVPGLLARTADSAAEISAEGSVADCCALADMLRSRLRPVLPPGERLSVVMHEDQRRA